MSDPCGAGALAGGLASIRRGLPASFQDVPFRADPTLLLPGVAGIAAKAVHFIGGALRPPLSLYLFWAVSVVLCEWVSLPEVQHPGAPIPPRGHEEGFLPMGV